MLFFSVTTSTWFVYLFCGLSSLWLSGIPFGWFAFRYPPLYGLLCSDCRVAIAGSVGSNSSSLKGLQANCVRSPGVGRRGLFLRFSASSTRFTGCLVLVFFVFCTTLWTSLTVQAQNEAVVVTTAIRSSRGEPQPGRGER